MSLPFFESPLRWKAGTTGKLEVVATVPITVVGVGEATPWEPQPASAMAPSTAAAAMTAGWRTAQDSNEPLRPGAREPADPSSSVPFAAWNAETSDAIGGCRCGCS